MKLIKSPIVKVVDKVQKTNPKSETEIWMK